MGWSTAKHVGSGKEVGDTHQGAELLDTGKNRREERFHQRRNDTVLSNTDLYLVQTLEEMPTYLRKQTPCKQQLLYCLDLK